MNAENIGKYLKELRINHKFTQEELAKKLHITRQAISSWENGRFIPDIEKIYDLANLYNLKIEDIYACGKIENNYNSNKIFIEKIHSQKKKYYVIISIIILIFLFLFLFYYFINSYKKTNIYTISSLDSSHKIIGNILKVNKNVYFELMINDYTSDNVCLYYEEKEITCIENSNTIKFNEKLGYEEYILTNNFNDFIKNLYVKINSDKIKLSISKYFINDDLIFDKSQNIEMYNKENSRNNNYIPKYIIENFKYDEENAIFFKEDKIKNKIFDVQFDSNINIITIKSKDEDNLKIWTFNVKDNKLMSFIEYNNYKILYNFNEKDIQNIDEKIYNKYFKDILDYLNNILN